MRLKSDNVAVQACFKLCNTQLQLTDDANDETSKDVGMRQNTFYISARKSEVKKNEITLAKTFKLCVDPGIDLPSS